MDQGIFSGTTGRTKIYILATTAVMTALLCVLAPISIPIGPVPISLATLVIYIAVYILGWKMASVSVAVYLLIGMVGVPVFSGFSAGVAKLAGPTGGYLIGYIPMAIVAGLAVDHFKNKYVHAAGFVLATCLLYALGTVWFCIVTGSGLVAALSLCVIPFIPGDALKIVIAVILGSVLRSRLKKALN